MTDHICSATGNPCRCGTPNTCQRRRAPITEADAVFRIHCARGTSYQSSRDLALFALDQSIYNIGQMISILQEAKGGQQRTDNQPELRDLQRQVGKIVAALGGKNNKFTL